MNRKINNGKMISRHSSIVVESELSHFPFGDFYISTCWLKINFLKAFFISFLSTFLYINPKMFSGAVGDRSAQYVQHSGRFKYILPSAENENHIEFTFTVLAYVIF